MKDSEFIELLNLYVDHEITPADAARLEAEVVGNAKRARIYREYCGMQKACMILADQFREAAPEAGKIPVTATRARGLALPFAAVSLAAAACLGVVLLARHPGAGSQTSLAQAQTLAPSPAARVAVAAPSYAAIPVDFPLVRPASGAERIDSQALLTSSSQQDPFAWMNRVQFAPIQRVPIEPFLLDPKSNLDPQNRDLGIPQGLQQLPVERTAFQLQLDK
jgi:hypothetical protein